MKKFMLLTATAVLLGIGVSAQVDIDKSINFSGTGSDAKISGIDTTFAPKDAVNAKTLQRGALVYADGGGTGSAYTLTLTPPVTAYTKGMAVNFKANVANSGAVTLSINGLGAIGIKKNVSTDLAANDIAAGQLVSLIFDGANFQLINKPAAVASSYAAINLTADNQVVTVGSNNYLTLNSNNTTATNRTFYLAAGEKGQQLILELTKNAADPALQGRAELLTDVTSGGSAMCRLSSNYTFTNPNSTISLIYNGTNWVETARSSTGINPYKQSFSYTGGSPTFIVPAGVTQLFVKLWGAGGGAPANWTGSGGSGAFVSGSLAVTPGQSLTILVGGKGAIAGGFGGGGNGFDVGSAQISGGGGGRSAIRDGSTELVTAGGGGGGGFNNPDGLGCYGGGGGATTGIDGGVDAIHGAVTAKGGTISAGGNAGAYTPPTANGTAGSPLQGGNGSTTNWPGGGGGGGYFGGGGGCGYWSGGGGGGSSFVSNLASVTNIAGNINAAWGITVAPNNTDVDYVAGVGRGSQANGNGGGDGLVVIYW